MVYTTAIEPTLLEEHQETFNAIMTEKHAEPIRTHELKTLQKDVYELDTKGDECTPKARLLSQIKQALHGSSNQKHTLPYSIIPKCAVVGCFTSGSFAGFVCGILMEKHILQAALTTCPLVIVTAAVAGLLIGALIGFIVAKQQHTHTSKSAATHALAEKPKDTANSTQDCTLLAP